MLWITHRKVKIIFTVFCVQQNCHGFAHARASYISFFRNIINLQSQLLKCQQCVSNMTTFWSYYIHILLFYASSFKSAYALQKHHCQATHAHIGRFSLWLFEKCLLSIKVTTCGVVLYVYTFIYACVYVCWYMITTAMYQYREFYYYPKLICHMLVNQICRNSYKCGHTHTCICYWRVCMCVFLCIC